MTTEDYVSFEIAKQMKERGFDVETDHELWYVIKQFSTGCHWNSCTYKVGDITREYDEKYCIPMPTIQMAMKWLRETYNVILWVEPHEGKYDIHYYQGPYHPKWRGVGYDKWEDACKAGIKFVFDCWYEYKPMGGELYV